MSLASQVGLLSTRVATEFKSIRTALLGKVDKISSENGVVRQGPIFSYFNSTTGTTDNVVVVTNLPFTGPMGRYRISFSTLTWGHVEGILSLYHYAPGTIYNPRWTSVGDIDITVQLAKTAGNKLVLIFNPAGTVDYVRLTIWEAETGYASFADADLNGWTASLMTDAAVSTAYSTTLVTAASRRVVQELDGKAPTVHTHVLTDLPEEGFKRRVKTVTTANHALSGLAAINGYTPVAGDRILVTAQTAGAANGIYDASSGAWTRSADANTSSKIAGAVVIIERGTFAGFKSSTTFASDGVLGTTVMSWYGLMTAQHGNTVGGFPVLDGSSKIALAQLPTTTMPVSTPQRTAIDYQKFHSWSDQEYAYEDYTQAKNLRWFIDSAAYAVTRYSMITTPEYWDYGTSAWVSWVAGLPTIKTMLDGSESTSVGIAHANRKFRWVSQLPGGYPLMALILLQTSWTAIAWPGNATITVESSTTAGGTFTLRNTVIFGAGTTGGGWGWHVKATDDMHTGDAFWRITVDLPDWVDSGVYTTFPITRLEVVSGYQGRSFEPWSVDYDRKVNYEITPSVAGVDVALSNHVHTGMGNVVRVVYTTTVPARPAGATYVTWVGQVDPAANMLAGDDWIAT